MLESMAVTEFTKMKISFALALLGTLFALHPFLDPYPDRGFIYLGYDLKDSLCLRADRRAAAARASISTR